MAVTFYPTVQPGVLDALVPYTFCLLARGANLIELTSGSVWGSSFVQGSVGGGDGPGLLFVEALDNPAPGGSPGDMAVRGSIIDALVPFNTARTYGLQFTATDSAGNYATATQTIVTRAWTYAAGYPSGSGDLLTFTTVAGSAPQLVTSTTFGLTGHGLGVGDRAYLLFLSAAGHSSASTGPTHWVVTAVPDANHFTAEAQAVYLGGIEFDASATGGTQNSVAYLCAWQSGRTQNDITSAAEVTGSWGTAISPYTITTDGSATPYAQGTPDGIGQATGVLSGTPVQFGWFPVTLIEGTMQRLCLFSIAAGSYATTLVAPSTVNTTAGSTAVASVTAPSLAGTTVTWSVANAPSTMTLTGISSILATLAGTFATPGSYPLTVTAAASNGMLVSCVITFVVAEGVPVVAVPAALAATFSAAAPVEMLLEATNNPTSWALSSAPGWLSIDNTGLLTGAAPAAGTYTVGVIATNGTGVSEACVFGLLITAPAGYIAWLHSNLALIDLQMDLRFRGVTSFYAVAPATGGSGSGGSGSGSGQSGSSATAFSSASLPGISIMQNDNCQFAILLFAGTQVSDATTIWLTARQDVDGAAIIDQSITCSSALQTVTGGQYYAMPLTTAVPAINDAITNLDDPGLGAPAVLTLFCQICVQRSGLILRSQSFLLNIIEMIAEGPLNQLYNPITPNL